MYRTAFALAALAVLSVAAPAQATTTLLSENFEGGTVGAFTSAGQVGVNTGQDYVNCCGGVGSGASLTNHFASFGSGNLPSGTLSSPVFSTLAGESYTLSFAYGAFGQGSEIIGLTLFTNGVPNPQFIATNPTTNLNSVLTSSYSFIFSPSFNGTFSFLFSSSGGANVDAFIDNVTLTTTASPPGTAPLPEPSTWAMMLLGFGVIGLAMRRRNANGIAQQHS